VCAAADESLGAARSTLRTLPYRVLTVLGARSTDICLTHVSTWLRRMRENGTSAKEQVRTARLIARSVPRSHTWRADHCS
jgi:hypothetical protein